MINDVLKYKRWTASTGAARQMPASVFAGGKQSADLQGQSSEAIKAPVQVIFGAKDQIIPADTRKDLARNVKVKVIPEAGHMPHMEAAGEVTRLIVGMARQ